MNESSSAKRQERTPAHRPKPDIHSQVGYFPVSTLSSPWKGPLPGSLVDENLRPERLDLRLCAFEQQACLEGADVFPMSLQTI